MQTLRPICDYTGQRALGSTVAGVSQELVRPVRLPLCHRADLQLLLTGLTRSLRGSSGWPFDTACTYAVTRPHTATATGTGAASAVVADAIAAATAAAAMRETITAHHRCGCRCRRFCYDETITATDGDGTMSGSGVDGGQGRGYTANNMNFLIVARECIDRLQ